MLPIPGRDPAPGSTSTQDRPGLTAGPRSFVTGVALLAGAVAMAIQLRSPTPSLELLVAWTCAFFVGEVMRFRTPTGHGNVSMAFPVHLAALPLVGAATLVPAAWIARLAADLLIMRSRWYRGLFNASQVSLAVAAGSLVFGRVLPGWSGVPATPYMTLVAGLGVATLGYVLVNQGLVTGILSLTTASPFLTTWKENFGYRVEIASSTALFLLAPVVTVMHPIIGFWSVAAFALPVLFVRDACERYLALKKAQRVLIGSERLAAKGEMAGSVAHELNNMLQIISGNLELHLLRAKNITQEEKLRFDRVQDTLRKMGALSKGLMDFSHQESRPVPTDLGTLVHETVAFIRPQNRFDGLEIDADTDERVGYVHIDPAQMQQVLTNLLFNAADALAQANTPTPRVHVRLVWLDSTGEVELTVSDNGPGIPTEMRHRVFEPGYTTKPHGHGFGLSTVFRIVKNHGGTIRVEDRPDGGARFVMRVPGRTAVGVLEAA